MADTSTLSDIHTTVTPLKGRRALVTGGTAGIGRAICALLAAEGVEVFTFGRDADALQDSLAHARSAGGKIDGMTADVTNKADIQRVFKKTDDMGGADIVIINAGLGGEAIADMKDRDWRYVVETNLTAAMAFGSEALQRMQKQGKGDILLVGSISADNRRADSSVYVATKAGMQGFAESFRKEAAEHGVRVCLIEPGQVGSDMQENSPKAQREKIHEAKMLRAEDIAVCVHHVLTQPARCVLAHMTIVPLKQGLT